MVLTQRAQVLMPKFPILKAPNASFFCVMRFGFIAIGLMLWSTSCFAQQFDDFTHKDLLALPSFSIYAQEGWNRSKVDHLVGNTPITPLTTRSWSGSFEYRRPITQTIGFSFGAGLGALAFDFYVKGSGFDEKNRQIAFNQYIPYRKLSLRVDKNFFIDDKYLLTPSIGFGLLASDRVEYYSGSSIRVDQDSSILVSQTRTLPSNDQPHFYLDAKLRFGKFLRWNDVLGIHLGYRHGFEVVRTMEYRAYPEIPEKRGEGHYLHRGSELYAGLSYTFNNYKKRKRQSQLAQSGRQTPKEIKKKRKSELETIRSNSYRVSVITGFSMIRERFTEGLYYNSKWAGPSEHLGVALAREKQRYFVGGQLLYNNFYTKYREPGALQWSQSTNINPVQVGAFAGTYWRSKSQHKRYLTFQGGLDIGYNSYFRKNDTLGSYWQWDSRDTMVAHTFMQNPIYPLVHLGIGTSIRLYDQLYWDFRVNYYQGFTKVYREDIAYNGLFGIDGSDRKFSRGSYLTFKTGLSLHLHQSRFKRKTKPAEK